MQYTVSVSFVLFVSYRKLDVTVGILAFYAEVPKTAMYPNQSTGFIELTLIPLLKSMITFHTVEVKIHSAVMQCAFQNQC